MNRFQLSRCSVEHERSDGGSVVPWDLAVPVIDGRPLSELVGAGHPGLVVRLVAPPSRQWLGEPSYVEGERVVVLDGSCGIAECCGVTARIEISDATVSWSDFKAHGRVELPPGLEFTFEKDEYVRAIAEVANLESTTWIRPG